MNWKPRWPLIQWPNLVLHIPTLILWYLVWFVGLVAILSFGHGFVVQMFENIPEAEVCFVAITVVIVFIALLAIVSEYVSNKKSEAVKAKEAKLNGTTYDEVNGAISQKFFWGYPVIATIAAIIIAFAVMFGLNEVAHSQYADYVSCPERVILIGSVAAFIVFALVDRYLLRAVMDGLFYTKVEAPAIERFLDGDVVDAVKEKVTKTISERVAKLKAAGLSEEEIDDIICASKK